MSRHSEQELNGLISAIGLGLFSADVRSQVEKVLAHGQTLEPGIRKAFVKAAERGVEHQARKQMPLAVLLFESRVESGLSVDDVASRVGLEAATVLGVEQGTDSIKAPGGAALAAWIKLTKITAQQAVAALRRDLLSTSRPAAAFAAQANAATLAAEDEEFVKQVEQQLAVEIGDSEAEQQD